MTPEHTLSKDAPASLKRIREHLMKGKRLWIGPKEAEPLSKDDQKAYEIAHQIQCHLCVQAPTVHASGHPGGPLSSFTFAYLLGLRRDPAVDQPLRYSAGHLSLLAYGLQWMFGKGASDERLASPKAIIEHFRTASGLPGHVEAGIGDIPFGTGPLGKGTSHGLGTAFGLKYLKKAGMVDVLLADGDSQEGQVMEAFRLAGHLGLGNLVVHGDWNDIQLSGIPSKTAITDMASIAESCGWNVVEVENGNDPAQVNAALNAVDDLKESGHPTFVCYYTTMGHGISFMEEGSNTGNKNYHGTPLTKEESEKAVAALRPLDALTKEYEPIRAKLMKRLAKGETETDFILNWKNPAGYKRAIAEGKGAARKDFGAVHLKALMQGDSRIVVLHADLAGSGGFEKLEKELPGRIINVGVAEANMYMMAAGMRQAGLLPVTYTFAAFGTNEARASARLIDINCGHTRCGVIHDCTHSGVTVGEDGETHQEQNYLNIPYRHTQVWVPGDSNQAGAMAEHAMELIGEGHQSVYVFSSRMDHPQITTPKGELIYDKDYRFDGKIDLVRGKGTVEDKATVLASGITLHEAIKAVDASEESIRLLNVSCIRPLDSATIVQAALETSRLIVVEDHNTEGGLASLVADIIADFQLPCSLKRLGLTQFYPSAKAEALLLIAGIDSESIADTIEDSLHDEVCGGEDSLITALYSLKNNISHSRFGPSLQPFLERLLEDKGYLERVREKWAERYCPPENLPSNDNLRKRLSGEISLPVEENDEM